MNVEKEIDSDLPADGQNALLAKAHLHHAFVPACRGRITVNTRNKLLEKTDGSPTTTSDSIPHVLYSRLLRVVQTYL